MLHKARFSAWLFLYCVMLTLDFKEFPVLETGRLQILQITRDDADAVLAIRSDPQTMKYIPRPLARNLEDAKILIDSFDSSFAANQLINWGIKFKGDQQLAGMICLVRMQPEHYRCEVGYILHPDYHKQGIISEAMDAVIAYVFHTLKFHSLEAVIDPENTASARVLLKKEFIREGRFRHKQFFEGRFLDNDIYSLINPEPF